MSMSQSVCPICEGRGGKTGLFGTAGTRPGECAACGGSAKPTVGADDDRVLMGQLVRSGRSDKYGQVYVERIGNTGFDDADEPIAVLRAQDDLAYKALVGYLKDSRSDPGVPAAQVASVERQVEAFRAWRLAHPEKIRKPGRRG